jgi:hypothetical protein
MESSIFFGNRPAANTLFNPWLLSDRAIPVDTAALKETMLDHAVAEQEEEDC